MARAPEISEEAPTRRTIIRATAWTLAGDGAGQVLRLASNIVLAWLLFPAAFGLMAIVNAVVQGAAMLSDVGISQSIVQNRRGNDRRFLDTAWTVQVIRGVGIFALICMLTWPAASFFGRDDAAAAAQLIWLLPVAGLTTIMTGFNSTKLLSLSRRLHLGPLVLLNFGTQLAGVAVAIMWAVIDQSVWALVAGALTAAGLKLAASHLVIPGPNNTFAWDRPAVRELIHFGKWIFLATIFGFFITRGNALIIGAFISVEQLGVYFIGSRFANVATKLLFRQSNRVVFPLYARLAEHEGDERFRQAIFRARAGMLAIVLPLLCLLVVFGPLLIRSLFQESYHDAGWMLQILAAGAIGMAINSTSMPVLLARGDSRRFFLVTVAQLVGMLAAVGIGGAYYGVTGLVVGIASASFLSYPVLALMVRKHRAWMPMLDAIALLASAALIAVGFLTTNAMGIA